MQGQEGQEKGKLAACLTEAPAMRKSLAKKFREQLAKKLKPLQGL